MSSAKVSICVQTNKDQGPYSSPCWGGGLRAILKGPGSSANVSICVQIEKDQGPRSNPGGGGLSSITRGTGSSGNVSICVQIEKDQGPGSSPGWGWGAKCNINRTRVQCKGQYLGPR